MPVYLCHLPLFGVMKGRSREITAEVPPEFGGGEQVSNGRGVSI